MRRTGDLFAGGNRLPRRHFYVRRLNRDSSIESSLQYLDRSALVSDTPVSRHWADVVQVAKFDYCRDPVRKRRARQSIVPFVKVNALSATPSRIHRHHP